MLQQVGDGPIYDESIKKCNIFKTLFTLYSKCHVVFNTADVLSDDVITALEVDIVSFLSFLRDNWPEVRITPKLHILEDHVASFLRQWHAGCGFYGEQGGESLHAIFKKKSSYKVIRNDCKRLEHLMNEYLASTNLKARSIHDTHEKMPRCKRKSDAL